MLRKIWWLLALCGAIEAGSAAMNLLMLDPDASLGLRRFGLPNAGWDMSVLALTAGICAIAAGVWDRGRDASWLFFLHGLALGAFGLIGLSPLARGPLSFRPISMLFVLMAVSAGAFALRYAQASRSSPIGRWFLNVCGTVLVAFAASFAIVGFGWVRLEPPDAFWIWMSSYFALCALLLLYLALRGQMRVRYAAMVQSMMLAASSILSTR